MPDRSPREDAARKALDLRRAGLSLDLIAERLSLPDAEAARAHLDEALAATESEFANRLEADRLDRLLVAVWPKAAQGELPAVDRALRISERREKLLSIPRENRHELRDAFDVSVATSIHTLPVDDALIQSGRRIAERIDEATATGEGQEITKALYLLPHMVNILRELLATPAARISAGVNHQEDKGGKLAQLRAVAKPA